MIQVHPSLLSADLGNFAQEIQAMESAGADGFHFDVMDGHFVPNLTFGPCLLRTARSITSLPLHVHLMVKDPDRFIPWFLAESPDIITFHIEAISDCNSLIQQIKKTGSRVGIALNPETRIDEILSYLPIIDLVLMMTVNPGFGGQSFLKDQIEKIHALGEYVQNNKLPIKIEIDGGVSQQNALQLRELPIHSLVAGTASFQNGPGHYADNIRRLKGLAS